MEKKNEDSSYKLHKKFTCTTNDLHEHDMSLFVKDHRAISALNHDDIDISEEAIPSEMIKI